VKGRLKEDGSPVFDLKRLTARVSRAKTSRPGEKGGKGSSNVANGLLRKKEDLNIASAVRWNKRALGHSASTQRGVRGGKASQPLHLGLPSFSKR